MAFPIGENPVDRFHKSSHSRKPPPDLPPTPRDKTGFGRAWKPATTHPQTSPGLAPNTSGQNRVRSRMETCFFGSGTNLKDGYPRPCHVRRHRNPAHFTSGWIRVCALLRLELRTSECHGPLSHYRFFYQRTKPPECFLKSTPELRPLTPSAQNPAREPLTPRMEVIR